MYAGALSIFGCLTLAAASWVRMEEVDARKEQWDFHTVKTSDYTVFFAFTREQIDSFIQSARETAELEGRQGSAIGMELKRSLVRTVEDYMN